MTRALILAAACLVLACACAASLTAWHMTAAQLERERALPADGERECLVRVEAAKDRARVEFYEMWTRAAVDNRRAQGGPAR